MDLFRRRKTKLLSKHVIERKQAEQKHQAVIQTAIEGFCLANPQGKIIDVNNAFCFMHGYSRDELFNMRIQDINVDFTKEPGKFTKETLKLNVTGGGHND